MADASFVQTDFRGGEWSPYAQGNHTDKEYTRGLNLCFNAFPIETGAGTRRPGTRWMAYTLNGAYAWLIKFAFAENAPYTMEFTDSNLRFFSAGTLVMTNDPQAATTDASNPVVVTTAGNHGWSTGDQVQFLFSTNQDPSVAAVVLYRQFSITVTGSTTFTLTDPLTGNGVDGSTFTLPPNTSVGRILDLTTVYTITQLSSLRSVQAEILVGNVLEGQVFILCPGVKPYVVANTALETSSAFAQFAINPAAFRDGPYLDPVTGASVTPSGLTGTVTLTGAPASTFASTDVGRLIRIFSEPLAWASGTAYTTGNIVKYTDGNYYTALANSTGKAPPTNPTLWAINPTGAAWAWGTITVYHSATSVDVAIDASQALLYTTAFSTFRLGVYNSAVGYPTCGVFHEGRLWLAGALGNRFDASNTNDPFNFAPSAPDGTVGDANAISDILNSDDVNPIVWLKPDHTGLVMGTLGGEWLVAASATNDPLTPSSIQAHRVSKYKCANIEPVRAPFGLLFVQAAVKRIIEYVADAWSQKFLGRNVTEKARHLTAANIAQLAYQQDLDPNVWVRKVDGSLAGMLYKRESAFISEPPVFTGWHKHALGSGGVIEAISIGPNADGTLETLTMSVLDPVSGFRHVEFMTDRFDETSTIQQAWQVDAAPPPAAIVEDLTSNTVKFYGYNMYVGRTLSLWVGGLDLGDYVVAADGSISVTLGGAAQSATVGLGLPFFTDNFITSFVGKSSSNFDVVTFRKFYVTLPSQPLGVQSYIDDTILTGDAPGIAVYDPTRNQFVIASVGGGSTSGFKFFNLDTGLMTKNVSCTTMFVPGVPFPSDNQVDVGGPTAQDADGNIYFYSGGAVIRQLNQSSLTITGSIKGKGTDPSVMGNACCCKTAGINYLIGGTGHVVAKANLQVINTKSMTFAYDSAVSSTDHDIEAVGAGFDFSSGKFSLSTAYALGYSSTTTDPLGIYTIAINAAGSVTVTRTGGITPANVDATWTNITNQKGIVFDRFDGNIIIWAETTDSVTNKHYIIKVNPLTAAIVWKTAVTGLPTTSFGLNQSYVNGKFSYTFTGTLVSVDTTSGAVTNTTPSSGYSAASGMMFDSRSGFFYAVTSLSSSHSPIQTLNSTPNSFTSKWAALKQNPGGTVLVEQQYALLPSAIGFTYTSQVQLLRQIMPERTGARNGPGFAKTRRYEKIGMQAANTQGISLGTDFAIDLHPAELKPNDAAQVIPITNLFTGVLRMETTQVYNFDGMICWQVTRPYPATVTALGGFGDTQDI